MSNYTLPSDKFYLRDKETGEAIDLWAPYAGHADEAETAVGTLKNTLDALTTSIDTLNGRVTGVSRDLDTLKGSLNTLNTNVTNNMNKYLEGYNKVHTHSLGTPWEDATLSAGLYELRLNCGDFGARLVFFYDKVESLGLNQLVFNRDTNMWYVIILDILVGSQTPPLSDSSIDVVVEAFDAPGSYTPYTDGTWELYCLASIK